MNINTDYTIRLGNRNIVKIMKGSTVIWEKSTTPVVTPDYFYIENAYNGNNTISISSTNKGSTGTWASSLQYSKDKSTWTTVSLADDINPVTISMNSGEKVFFRNNNGYFNCITSGYNRITTFNCNQDFNVGGNINTLLNYQDVTNASLSEYCFYDLLKEDIRYSTHLKDASNLILPATTLANACYSGMFSGCTSMTTSPSLPATTLANACYNSMFSNCWSITSAPALPATTLAKNCYGSMFNECLALTTAPELPATTLAEQCYYNMFGGCSSLNSVTTYANDISASYCLQSWLKNVAATGTFYNNGSATYTIDSASGIPQGWTEVKQSQQVDYFYIKNTNAGKNTLTVKSIDNQSSETHATSLQYSKDKDTWVTINLPGTYTISMSYGDMVYFRNDNGYFNCTDFYTSFSCNKRHNVGGDITTLLDYTNGNVSLKSRCFTSLFENDGYLIKAVNLVLPTTTAYACYENLFRGCTSLTDAPTLPATTLAEGCYNEMFFNCSSMTVAPTLPATTLTQDCYRYMLAGTGITTAPTLPATNLAVRCYKGMFEGCSSLTTAPTLPVTTLAADCYSRMFNGCTSLTTAPELPATTLSAGCYYQMFYGCSSLNSVTIYANNISASDCLYNWLGNVAATGTFYNNGSATYSTGASGIPSGWTEVKPYTGPNYFYLENVDSNSGNVSFTYQGTPSESTIQQLEWSKDKTNWTPVTLTANTTTNVPVSVGEKVYFRNSNGKCSINGISSYLKFTATISNNVGGNIYTLLDYTNENVSLPQYAFANLFNGNNKLLDASNLVLPWMTLTFCCYQYMFQGCTALTTAPTLPATTLTNYCYGEMFRGCSSLTTAPALPSTTISNYCYNWMFYGCSSLTTAPELPATTLKANCYNGMFNGCTSLNKVTTYANDISASKCLRDWLKNVASTGTFHNLGSATYPSGTSGIPDGWTEVKS